MPTPPRVPLVPPIITELEKQVRPARSSAEKSKRTGFTPDKAGPNFDRQIKVDLAPWWPRVLDYGANAATDFGGNGKAYGPFPGRAGHWIVAGGAFCGLWVADKPINPGFSTALSALGANLLPLSEGAIFRIPREERFWISDCSGITALNPTAMNFAAGRLGLWEFESYEHAREFSRQLLDSQNYVTNTFLTSVANGATALVSNAQATDVGPLVETHVWPDPGAVNTLSIVSPTTASGRGVMPASANGAASGSHTFVRGNCNVYVFNGGAAPANAYITQIRRAIY